MCEISVKENSHLMVKSSMTTRAVISKIEQEDDYVRKHVNAVALMPVKGGRRITKLGRKLFNVLLHRAQDDGMQTEYTARLHEVLTAANYDSKDAAPVRKILLELMSTTVEWQSPSSAEIETWEACGLLSGAGTRKDKATGAVTVFWRYDTKVRDQLLSPDRYARLSLEAITQLSTHAAMALYEICARYVDNPGHKTSKQHWRWWRPVLTGVASDDSKAEYRFFKRDVLTKAVAEINALTNLDVVGPIEFKERDNKTIAEIQFEVRLKSHASARANPTGLKNISVNDLPIIGRSVNLGVGQGDAETLLRKHGPEQLSLGLVELEKRLAMPSEKVGEVLKKGGWLRAHLSRVAQIDKPAPTLRTELTSQDIKTHRASLTDEWLTNRKDEILIGFQEVDDAEKSEILALFRAEMIERALVHVVRRFDLSGWQHKMVSGTFVKFLGLREVGEGWDKPSAEDLFVIAARREMRAAG